MGIQRRVSRRQFFISTAAVGGGMVIGLTWVRDASAAFADRDPWQVPDKPGVAELSPWLTIGPDDIVTVRSSTPDIGNGVMTQTAMTITEELECDWDKVRVEFASANRDFIEKNVYSAAGPLAYFSGRSTAPNRMPVLLQVGASARERLKTAAAQTWNVPVGEIEAKKSVLTHRPTGRTLRYGEVAARAATIKLETEPKPKPQSEWTLLGKATPPRLQNPLITNGSINYGIDVRLPNMVYAALLQSPVHGGKLKSYDFAKIKDMPGVRSVVVVDPSEPRKLAQDVKSPFPLGLSAAQSAVAVIADHYWQAKRALDALPVEWDDGPGANWKSTEQLNQAAYDALKKEGSKIEKSRGNALELVDKQSKVVEASYLTPYCDHVTMEPLNGTALVTPDRVDVWHPSQHSQQGLYIAAEETGLPIEKVHFHQTWVGTGFGRRVYGDDARMVVAVAKKFPGRPVQVIWSREESIRQGRLRALMAARLKAGLGPDGLPVAWLAYASGGRGFSMRGLHDGAYAADDGIIPNVHVTSETLQTHILTGPYRGPGFNSTAFFIETFTDECALAAGIDPLEYRLRLYAKWPDPGWIKCLKEVAEKSGWGKPLPRGMGQGIAISNWGMGGKPRAGTTVAAVATVEVSRRGELKIHAMDVAFDTGRIVNRDAIASQMEGGVIFGLNMTLNEGLKIKDGRVVEGNYDEYPMLRMADMPKKINVHFGGLSDHDRFGEIGEPPVGPIGPAVGNAIFRATGKRLRTTPFRELDLSWS
jgi:isoquinoline 1-oxidoreductase beta subunit